MKRITLKFVSRLLGSKTRSLLLLLSSIVYLAAENPVDFGQKLAQFEQSANSSRARNLARWFSKWLLWLGNSEASRMVSAGHLALAEIALKDERNILRSISARQRLTRAQSKLEFPTFRSHPLLTTDEPKVLMILTNSFPYTQSGYSIRSHELLQALNKIGTVVVGLTRFAYPATIGVAEPTSENNVDGVCYRRALPLYIPFNPQIQHEEAVKFVMRNAKDVGATILHTTTPFQNAKIVSDAAARLKLPWVYEVRGIPELTWAASRQLSEEPKRSEWFKAARASENEAMKASDAVIVLSETSKKSLVARGVNPQKIVLVPNSISLKAREASLTKEECRDRLRLLLDGRYVGIISSLVEYEGIDIAIEAMKSVDAAIQLIIVGNGAERRNLEKLRDRNGLSHRVHFVGQVPTVDIALWYKSLDALIVPRKPLEVCRTVTPIKTLMASALDVPIIAADLPALREVTGDFEHYFEPGSPSKLAACITATFKESKEKDPAKADWLATRSWEYNAKVLQRAYKEICRPTADKSRRSF